MTPDVAVLSHDLAPRRPFLVDGPIVPVLIRVPALRTSSRRRARRRRRLRREVRVGGLALLVGVPLIGLGLSLPRSGSGSGTIPPAEPRGVPSTATATVEAAEPPVVSLVPALEPVALPAASSAAMTSEYWVNAWSADRGTMASPPAAASERPGTVEQPIGGPVVWTSGYLLPELPAAEDRDGAEESVHARH